MDKDIKTEKFGVGDILNKAWNLLTNNFKTYLAIVLILYVPFYFFLEPLLVDGEQPYLLISYFIIAFILNLIFILSLAFITGELVENRKTDFKTALQKSFFKLGNGLATQIVTGLVLFVLFLLLIIPGIIYSVYYAFTLFIVMLKDKYIFQAMNYSKEVVKGRWWRILGVFVLISFLGAIASSVFSLPLAFATHFLWQGTLSVLLHLVQTFVVIAFVVFFINLDNVRE